MTCSDRCLSVLHSVWCVSLNLETIIYRFWFCVIHLRFWMVDAEVNGACWRSSGAGVRGRLWACFPLRCVSSLCQCSSRKWGLCVFTDVHIDALNTCCMNVCMLLQPEPLSDVELLRSPCANAVCSLEKVLHVQSENRCSCWFCLVFLVFCLNTFFSLRLSGLYWHSVRSMLNTVSLSYVKAERRVSAGTEAALVLSGLNMNRRQ